MSGDSKSSLLTNDNYDPEFCSEDEDNEHSPKKKRRKSLRNSLAQNDVKSLTTHTPISEFVSDDISSTFDEDIVVKNESNSDNEQATNNDGDLDSFYQQSVHTFDKKDSQLTLSNDTMREHILTGHYKITVKLGRSKVWDLFGHVTNDKGEKIANYVACKSCYHVYKYSKHALSNLTRHKCYVGAYKESMREETVEPNEEMKKACADVLTEWVIRNCRPYTLVDDEGLKKFAQFMFSLGNKVGPEINIDSLLPQSTKIHRNVQKLYEINLTKLKDEINLIKNTGYALTSDVWTDPFLIISYIAVTIHYVLSGKYTTKLLGIKSMKNCANTSYNIKNKMEALLSEFNCSLSDPAVIVTKRDNNVMEDAFKESENLFCINHLINKAVEQSIENIPQVKEIVQSASKLVKYFKNSGLDGGLMTTLKNDSPTKWNHVYIILFSIHSNFREVQRLLREKNNTEKYSVLKENHLELLVDILKPFKDASEELEGDSYCTLHLVHANIHLLKVKCSIKEKNLPIFLKEFKESLFEALTCSVEQNIHLYHKIGIFLFPPANQLSQFSFAEQAEIINKCKALLSPCAVESKVEKQTSKPNTSRMFNLFQNYASTPPISKSSSIESEIMKYKNTITYLDEGFNVLKWWDDHKKEFPFLFKLSSRILAIPASSTPSERVFSYARTLLTEEKSRISANPKSFNEIMFIHYNTNETVTD